MDNSLDGILGNQPATAEQERWDKKGKDIVDAEVVTASPVQDPDTGPDLFTRCSDALPGLDTEEATALQQMIDEGRTFFQMVKVIRRQRDAQRPSRRRAG